MNIFPFSPFKSFVLILVAATLAACGGGGDEGGTAPTTPGNTSGNMVTSVPAPSYAAGSEELAAFSYLNAQRERCGFGLLAQSTAADRASRAHADWVIVNGIASHSETSGSTGFTGSASEDRLVASGYAAYGAFDSQDDFFVRVGSASKSGVGTLSLQGLLGAPYHSLSLLDGFRDIGISIRNSNDVTAPYATMVVAQFNPAYKYADGRQQAAAGTVRTYPCAGSTNVNYALYNESPNPVPGRDLSTSPLGGIISLQSNDNETLVVTSASMINVATSQAVNLRATMTAMNDPNGRLNGNQAVIMADAPMASATQYQATIVGTVNGTGFTKTFTFTTAQ